MWSKDIFINFVHNRLNLLSTSLNEAEPLGRAFRPKPDGQINKNHKDEYSDQMAEMIGNHEAEFYH